MFNFFKKQGLKIKAIQDRDLGFYLRRLGVYDQIVDQKIHCNSCGDLISLETIQAIIPKDGKITFLCFRPKCINIIHND